MYSSSVPAAGWWMLEEERGLPGVGMCVPVVDLPGVGMPDMRPFPGVVDMAGGGRAGSGVRKTCITECRTQKQKQTGLAHTDTHQSVYFTNTTAVTRLSPSHRDDRMSRPPALSCQLPSVSCSSHAPHPAAAAASPLQRPKGSAPAHRRPNTPCARRTMARAVAARP